ncbi:hypothetical protein [Frigoriglobus tundricola]|uniref:Uncharacterized protein n=1 Tax=Frigoriglobus tundricola TaxID=2774151 RepID=A0A6M5YGU5_9BACT|nr:hypothetical protein [Frigoriglobus tundricola]QJW92506.1 hypothetical protein FTUN_0002 [Frigoriglobus tundricola]
MVHAGYCGYWWELYRTVTEVAPTKTLLMDDDLGDLIRVSEQIAGTAEVIGIDSTPMVQFLIQAQDCYYGTGSALPVANPVLDLLLTRVRLALTERERTNSSPSLASEAELPELTAPYDPSPAPPKPFEFADITKPPFINGKQKPFLTQAEHNILTALAKAGPRGLTKDELDKQSGHTESRKYLRKLAKDPDWASVILFPEQKGRGGYRLRIS